MSYVSRLILDRQRASVLPDVLSHDSVSLHWSATWRVEQVIRSTYKGEVYGLSMIWFESQREFLHCNFSSIITFNKILKQHLEMVTYSNLPCNTQDELHIACVKFINTFLSIKTWRHVRVEAKIQI